MMMMMFLRIVMTLGGKEEGDDDDDDDIDDASENVDVLTCIPRRAKIIIKRKRRSSKDAMDFMELRSEATKLRSEAQYLVICGEKYKKYS